MTQYQYMKVEVDKKGRLIIPPELMSSYGIKPGTYIRFDANPSGLQLKLPARLAKLYIEVTARCNLKCRTCVRNTWDEAVGNMSVETFSQIIEGLRALTPPPTIFFGGFGEPLLHPDIVNMVARAKSLDTSVELITNATLLTKDLSQALIKAGLDRLWGSLDGATPETYAAIRPGADLPKILENLTHFQHKVYAEVEFGNYTVLKTQLGISFVAMRRNIAELPAVIDIGKRFGAERFLVTNVLPYTREMVDETLYYRALQSINYRQLSLPGIDVDENTYATSSRQYVITMASERV